MAHTMTGPPDPTLVISSYQVLENNLRVGIQQQILPRSLRYINKIRHSIQSANNIKRQI